MRRPRKTRMSCHDAVDLPAAEYLPDHISTTTQEREIPKTRRGESMFHVVVRWATFLTQVLWERLVSDGAGTFVRQRVDTLGPTINRVELKSATEATRQTRIHRVVVCIHVRRRNEHRKREIVCRYDRLHEELVHKSNQLVTRAALVAHGRREVVRQRVLSLE